MSSYKLNLLVTASILLFLVLSIVPLPVLASKQLQVSDFEDINQVALENLLITEVNYFGSLDQGEKCRNDADLKKTSQCGFAKWIELFNPTNQDVDLTGYSIFTDSFNNGNNINIDGYRSEVVNLDQLIIPANSFGLVINQRTNQKNSLQTQQNVLAKENLYKISSKGDLDGQYTKLNFYIAESPEQQPLLEFSHVDLQTDLTEISTLSSCDGEIFNLNSQNTFQKNETQVLLANPGQSNCDFPKIDILLIEPVETEVIQQPEVETVQTVQTVVSEVPEIIKEVATPKEGEVFKSPSNVQTIPNLEPAQALPRAQSQIKKSSPISKEVTSISQSENFKEVVKINNSPFFVTEKNNIEPDRKIETITKQKIKIKNLSVKQKQMFFKMNWIRLSFLNISLFGYLILNQYKICYKAKIETFQETLDVTSYAF